MVAAYTRVSCEEQTKGLSLAAQESKIKAFAQSQGWQIGEVYCDPGFSGKDLNRPALQRMIEDIKNKRVEIVLTYRLDRLSRRQRDLLFLVEDIFTANDCGFKSVTENFDTVSPQGKAMMGMLSVFSQLERDTISARIKDSLAHKKQNGEWCGRAAFGYQISQGAKQLSIIKDQAQIIQFIFKRRAKGKTLQAISEELIKRGINGRTWCPPLLLEHLAQPHLFEGDYIPKKLFNKINQT